MVRMRNDHLLRHDKGVVTERRTADTARVNERQALPPHSARGARLQLLSKHVARGRTRVLQVQTSRGHCDDSPRVSHAEPEAPLDFYAVHLVGGVSQASADLLDRQGGGLKARRRGTEDRSEGHSPCTRPSGHGAPGFRLPRPIANCLASRISRIDACANSPWAHARFTASSAEQDVAMLLQQFQSLIACPQYGLCNGLASRHAIEGCGRDDLSGGPDGCSFAIWIESRVLSNDREHQVGVNRADGGRHCTAAVGGSRHPTTPARRPLTAARRDLMHMQQVVEDVSCHLLAHRVHLLAWTPRRSPVRRCRRTISSPAG